MTEVWNATLELNWPVLAVVLAIVVPVTFLVVAGLLAFGLYIITRVPPIRWVFVTLIEAATNPVRRWAEDTIDERMEPVRQLVEWDALAKMAQILTDQGRLAADVYRAEGKAEKAAELAMKVETATDRLRSDVDELARRLPDQVTEGEPSP